MGYSLRNRSSTAAPAEVKKAPVKKAPAKKAPAKKAASPIANPKAASPAAVKKSARKSGKLLHRPSLPLVDAKKRVILELAKAGHLKPSQVQEKKRAPKPIALQKKVVHPLLKELSHHTKGKIVKPTGKSAKELNTLVLTQVKKLAPARPSQVKSKVLLAPVHLILQAEILKKAMLKEIKGRSVKSPIKTPVSAPKSAKGR